ncbi:MAG: stage II sporulation protein M [archaeon]
MLESLINPQKKERGPIKMLFVGILYASLSLLLVKWFFGADPVLSKYSGFIVIAFCIMFTLPFMYYLIKQEEEEDENAEGIYNVWKAHGDALYAFMWLFLGMIIAFSFWNIVLEDPNLFNAQLETYCQINSPGNVKGCIERYSFGASPSITGEALSKSELRLLAIIENNVYVMIFTLLFSLIFGAGAIFVLAWNASVISTAISVFTKSDVTQIPTGILRYMIHGFPEIAAYFITALAGGIFGVGILRNGIKDHKFLRVLENTFLLLFTAIFIILIAGVIEVYFTPLFFK